MRIRGLGVIRIGDKNVRGGTVISGGIDSSLGKAIARVNDLVDCPAKYPDGRPHGINKIIEGTPYFISKGLPVALDGHISECGCALISSIPPTESDAVVPGSYGRRDVSASLLIPNDEPPTKPVENLFDEKFVLRDSSGQPLSNVAYAIERASGTVEDGGTDSAGHTYLLSAVAASEKINIYIAG